MSYDETLDAVWAATTPARRRAALDATLRDMAADCLFYGRKDDEVLPVGAIERMLVTGEVSLDFILATVGGAFHAALADDAVAEPDADEPDEPLHQGYKQARALLVEVVNEWDGDVSYDTPPAEEITGELVARIRSWLETTSTEYVRVVLEAPPSDDSVQTFEIPDQTRARGPPARAPPPPRRG